MNHTLMAPGFYGHRSLKREYSSVEGHGYVKRQCTDKSLSVNPSRHTRYRFRLSFQTSPHQVKIRWKLYLGITYRSLIPYSNSTFVSTIGSFMCLDTNTEHSRDGFL